MRTGLGGCSSRRRRPHFVAELACRSRPRLGSASEAPTQGLNAGNRWDLRRVLTVGRSGRYRRRLSAALAKIAPIPAHTAATIAIWLAPTTRPAQTTTASHARNRNGRDEQAVEQSRMTHFHWWESNLSACQSSTAGLGTSRAAVRRALDYAHAQSARLWRWGSRGWTRSAHSAGTGAVTSSAAAWARASRASVVRSRAARALLSST